MAKGGAAGYEAVTGVVPDSWVTAGRRVAQWYGGGLIYLNFFTMVGLDNCSDPRQI